MTRIRIALASRGKPVLQDATAHRQIGGRHADDDTALHARAHALIDALKLRRGTIGSDHHLLAAVEQLVEHVTELLLYLLASQELHIVDQQDVVGAKLLLEVECGAVAQRPDELDDEALDRQVAGAAVRIERARLVRDRLQEVRFPEPDARMDIERVIRRRASLRRRGDRARRAACDVVRTALAEGREGQARVERRAGEAISSGLHRRRGRRLPWGERRSGLIRHDSQRRPPHHVDAANALIFLTPEREQPVAVV